MSEVTFSAYDERMRPMFVKLAERVRENGQESEYETLAESIDAPSLDDLIGPAERCGMVTVPYRMTVIYEGEVSIHVDDLTQYINDGINEGDFFSLYRDEIRDAIAESDGGEEIERTVEPHPSDYVSTESYCD